MKKMNQVLKGVATAVMLTGMIYGVTKTYQIMNTSAYLTDTDAKTNVFTVGKIDIIGKEPNWPGYNPDDPDHPKHDDNHNDVPDETENTVPNQETSKNPIVENVDQNNSAIVFMKVTVPRKKVTLVNDDGTLSDHDQEGKPDPQLHDIYYLKTERANASDHRNTFNGAYSSTALSKNNQGEKNLKTTADGLRVRKDGNPSYELSDQTPIIDVAQEHWIELGANEVTTSKESTYVFGYSIPLEPGKETISLFDKVQLINHIEGELSENEIQNIKVNYYAIQGKAILENAVDLTENLNETNLTKIFNTYMNQNLEDNYTGTSGDRKIEQPVVQ